MIDGNKEYSIKKEMRRVLELIKNEKYLENIEVLLKYYQRLDDRLKNLDSKE